MSESHDRNAEFLNMIVELSDSLVDMIGMRKLFDSAKGMMNDMKLAVREYHKENNGDDEKLQELEVLATGTVIWVEFAIHALLTLHLAKKGNEEISEGQLAKLREDMKNFKKVMESMKGGGEQDKRRI
tara:strand:- start:58 stop:441 length:384 start_codon:yes stop_codon:yes gene_type:complete